MFGNFDHHLFDEFTPMRTYYSRPHRHNSHIEKLQHSEQDGSNEDIFNVHFDVGDFTAGELSVKTVDHVVVIEGKHEEKENEKRFVSRQFTRRYPIPEGYDAGCVKSSLSADGKRLTVNGPKQNKE